MKYSYTAKKRIRKNFGKLGDVLQMPNLIQLQMDSYNHFIGKNGNKIDYNKSALHSVLNLSFQYMIMPITVNLNIQVLD